ncbi:hypothetical protein GNI_054570 [Gregarina niphandrodes]|uniref:Uncharacterized protein n=1 Tax=Gregarina niphandrodes TaxID=110365 RepID=A0A023B921_GRENI|nr:hypothetical protein GNI_054570 [Gregarina niphandrodes]EZG70704.1 hypothetical protein GNI_054570 [Gregarina niphandrodes]|eukprot:XP_011129887.1 hypothetical protein GNI_054570 [Gregarina niphandrodes]
MLCFKTVVEQKIVRPGVGENKKLNGKQLRDRYGLTSDTAEKFDEVHHQIQMNVPRSKFILSRLQTLIKEGKLDFKMLRRDNNNRISSYFKTLFYSRTLGGSVGRRSGGRSADARRVGRQTLGGSVGRRSGGRVRTSFDFYRFSSPASPPRSGEGCTNNLA